MLRASCSSNQISIDLSVVRDPDAPCAIPHHVELIAFADALLRESDSVLAGARERLRAVVGDEGVLRAAAVVGNFQMMNRALDTIGATLGEKLPPALRQLAATIGVRPPPHFA